MSIEPHTSKGSSLEREIQSLDIRAFGVGCMPLEQPLGFIASGWPDLVRDALLAISAISNVEIYTASSGLMDIPAEDPPTSLPPDNEREFFWPEPDFGAVQFDVHIPSRMQPALLHGLSSGGEDFHVRTSYGYYGPCTFVSVLGGPDEGEVNPASAVALVHAFVSSELAKLNTPIRMARVGPSPFHMEAVLKPGETGESPFAFELRQRVGYSFLDFTYDVAKFADVAEAERALQTGIESQLQLFYSLERESNRRWSAASELSREASALVKRHSARGTVAWFDRVFRTGGDARRLGMKALQARLVAADDARRAEESIRDTFEQSFVLAVFEEQLRRVAQEGFPHEIDNAGEVVRLAESSRRGDFEVAIIAASTLLGGAAGAIAAVLMGTGS